MTYRKRYSQPCADCGETFESARPDARFCSGACRVRSARRDPAKAARHRELQAARRARTYVPVRYQRTCRICGTTFETKVPAAQVCSKKCRNRTFRHLRKERRASDRSRRIRWEQLVERDGLACSLCGDDCDPADFSTRDGHFVPGITYPTVDHVVPLSLGGPNDESNVRLAHHLCNIQKGARTAA